MTLKQSNKTAKQSKQQPAEPVAEQAYITDTALCVYRQRGSGSAVPVCELDRGQKLDGADHESRELEIMKFAIEQAGDKVKEGDFLHLCKGVENGEGVGKVVATWIITGEMFD